MMEAIFEELHQRLGLPVDTPTYSDPNNNSGTEKSGDKYSLRPRSSRRRTAEPSEKPTSKTTRTPKAKQKPAPLSKYRRKTANARERSRMREINQAFETLRRAVPSVCSPSTTNEKLTKITTLRLAMKYISSLSATLTNSSESCGSFSSTSDYSDLDCLLLESDGESLPLSDHSLLASPEFDDVDFADDSLPSVDMDFSPLSDDFSDHLCSFDPFLADIS